MPAGYEEDREEERRRRTENADPWMRARGIDLDYAEPHYRDLWTRELGAGDGSGGGGGGGSGGGSAVDDLDQWVKDMRGIPLVGGPADEQYAAAVAADAERANRDVWDRLQSTAPTIEQLTTDYYLEDNRDAYGDLMGDPSQLAGMDPNGTAQQQASMRALQGLYQSGGWTDRDSVISGQLRRASAMERGQQLRGANEAALQQMSARGMGGGGAEMAARLSASQGLAQGQAMSDMNTNALMHQAAMQRAMAGLQGWQSGANTVSQQDLARRNALDAFNQQNTSWRRDRESRNTAWANRGQESKSQAYQTAYENRERGAAGRTNQYPTDVARRQAEGERKDRQNAGLLAAVGEVIDL